MRQILFKAKRIDNGEWVEGSLIQSPYMGEIRSWISSPDDKTRLRAIATYYGDWRAVEVRTDTICQYTGLTDKNGCKIWENDVVKIDEDVKALFDVDDGQIRYYGGAFLLGNNGIKSSLFALSDIHYVFRGKVIGNIFDNPELLKGGA